MITLTEAASRLGLKQNDTLYQWEKDGKIKIVRENGRVRLVDEGVIENIRKEREDKVVPRGMRRCTVCGFLGEFARFATGRNKCLECYTKLENDRYHENKESHKEARLAYSDKNREGINKKAKTWYKNNKKRVKVQNIEKLYGLTQFEYEYMCKTSDYKCNICKIETGRLCVDHDHNHSFPKSKEAVRGLLCNNCNSVLGFVGDDITILQNAIEYLKAAQQSVVYNK